METKSQAARQAFVNGAFNMSASNLMENNDQSQDDYDPFQHRNPNGLGTMGAVSHMIKGSLGSGILAMGMAFKNGGLWVSLIGAVLIGYLCTHCVKLLVVCSHALSKRVRVPSLGFAETVETAFLTGPVRLRKYSNIGRESVNISIFLAYYLGVTVYIIIIATNFQQVVQYLLNINLNIRLYILSLTVVLVPLGCIRSLRYLVPLSMVALAFLMFGCGTVLYECLHEIDMSSFNSRPFFSSWSTLPLFYATMCFSIEGIGTVLPIENAMKSPKNFLPLFGVLNLAMVWLVVTYSIVGFFGYLRFGEATEGNITLNLGYSPLGVLVKVLVALNVLFSYPLIFTPCSESAWLYVEPRLASNNRNTAFYTMRILMVLGTVGLATALPNIEPFIGLVGTICYSTLGILFPALLELLTFWEADAALSHWPWRRYKGCLLAVAWLICLVAGLIASIESVISSYKE